MEEEVDSQGTWETKGSRDQGDPEKASVPQAPNNNASSRRMRWRSINEAKAM